MNHDFFFIPDTKSTLIRTSSWSRTPAWWPSTGSTPSSPSATRTCSRTPPDLSCTSTRLEQVFLVLACHSPVLDGLDWHFQASVHFPLSSAINKSQWHHNFQRKTIIKAGNRTQGCWVRSKNATSVLCSQVGRVCLARWNLKRKVPGSFPGGNLSKRKKSLEFISQEVYQLLCYHYEFES